MNVERGPTDAASAVTPLPLGLSELILDVKNIAGGYGDIVVVKDVSLQARKGTMTVVLGRNGAGKTTTIRLIAGLNRCRQGSIVLDGVDIAHLAPYERLRAGISTVQEGRRIFRKRSVEENLLIGGFVRSRKARKLASSAQEVYDLFPVLGRKKQDVGGVLSGGEQQMLAIGQALMAQPRILILDEPSIGLAPSITAEVLTAVNRLKDETGLAVILVEQAITEALRIGDDMVVIELGRTVLTGSAREPGTEGLVRRAYFGE
jgi:branched-chain amino acid transport system ATP-binding protein